MCVCIERNPAPDTLYLVRVGSPATNRLAFLCPSITCIARRYRATLQEPTAHRYYPVFHAKTRIDHVESNVHILTPLFFFFPNLVFFPWVFSGTTEEKRCSKTREVVAGGNAEAVSSSTSTTGAGGNTSSARTSVSAEDVARGDDVLTLLAAAAPSWRYYSFAWSLRNSERRFEAMNCWAFLS